MLAPETERQFNKNGIKSERINNIKQLITDMCKLQGDLTV